MEAENATTTRKGRGPLGMTMLALAAVAAALLLVACGGSDSSTSSSTSSSAELTTDEYQQQVQGITAAFASGFGELTQKAANPTSADDFQKTVVAIQAKITETIDAINALNPPANLVAINDQLAQAFTDYRDGYDPIVEALQSGDNAALKSAAKQIPDVVQQFQTDYQQVQQDAAAEGVTIEATSSTSSSSS